MILAGLVDGIGGLVAACVIRLADYSWWTVVAIVLACAFREPRRKRYARVLAGIMIALPLLLELLPLVQSERWLALLNDAGLAFMLTVLGLLIVLTNDPRRQTWLTLRRGGHVLDRKPRATIAVCIAAVGLLNPENSHALCVKGSQVCERYEAYDSAIVLAKLARDTFPQPTFCGSCWGIDQSGLSTRITGLEIKKAGGGVELTLKAPASRERISEFRVPRASR
ncbi:MAG: hypothetical protein CMJ48_13770 [Planctomycetaceae bacterium]|nr:hypothetical protein [Planctomycetaceae bacterium]